MKLIKVLMVLVILTTSSWVAASSDIRLKHGKVLIRKGDQISELHEHIRPSRSYSGKVCMKPSNPECDNRNYTHGRIYEYDMKDRGITYIVQTNGNLITHIKWRKLSFTNAR